MRWPYWTGRSLPTTTTATASTGAGGLGRAAGNNDVLFAIQHERHRRSRLRQTSLQVEKLSTGVCAIRKKPVVDTGKDKVSCRRQAPTLIESSGQSAPFLFLGNRIPRDQNVAASGRSDCRHARRLRTSSPASTAGRRRGCRGPTT